MDILDFLFPKFCLECKKEGSYICPNCLRKVHRSANPNAIWEYEGVIRKAILALKYKFASSTASELAEACAKELKTRKYLKKITLVPVPLHKKRQNWRGFNQAEVVGKVLAQQMNWQFLPDLLVRTRNVRPQVGLKSSQRHQNIKDVFNVNPKNKPPINSQILVFDDVATTGSTLNEARKVLKEAGFKSVHTLAIAS